MTDAPARNTSEQPTRRSEFVVFAMIAALIWPIVTFAIVGGYGFVVWMSQLVLGPPGPPGH
jgi:periplasmic nitrate reductase NapE